MKSLEDRFRAYHGQNPQVLEELENLAADWFARGRGLVGMQLLFEVLRWQTSIKTHGDKFKINNNYAAYYARLIIERNPAWAGYIRTRELRAV